MSQSWFHNVLSFSRSSLRVQKSSRSSIQILSHKRDTHLIPTPVLGMLGAAKLIEALYPI